VTDFIYFHFWPLFNVADMSIVAGVILLALNHVARRAQTFCAGD